MPSEEVLRHEIGEFTRMIRGPGRVEEPAGGGKPVVLVRFEGVIAEQGQDRINAGAIAAMLELQAIATVIVFSEELSRSSIRGWLGVWGVPHDDACNILLERPPLVRAVIDVASVPIKRNPGFREWDVAVAGVAERLGIPWSDPA